MSKDRQRNFIEIQQHIEDNHTEEGEKLGKMKNSAKNSEHWHVQARFTGNLESH